MGPERQPVCLLDMPLNATGEVAQVRVPPAQEHMPSIETVALRLIEIGFIEGEPLRVIAFGQPGDDPIGVRLGGKGGQSTFALRREEAAFVWVRRSTNP